MTKHDTTNRAIQIVGLAAFAGLAVAVQSGWTKGFDWVVLIWLRGHASPALTWVMKIITDLGSWVVVVPVSVLVALWLYSDRERRGDFPFFVLAVAGASLLNGLLKWAFQRPRPGFGLVEAAGYSFPSGHSMEAFSFYGSVAILLWGYARSRRAKVMLAGSAAVLVAAVGLSRMYLGVHYPSDVIGGFIASTIWLSLCAQYARGRRDSGRRAVE
ncbi:phosphatase PAP2 family protein [Kyrpidia spormannii]|uniref:Phospholipid phosphatase n=1 Tax=Kyrpidia spormannii TaxID=2055160 RepID=A0A6F9DZH2_9BACL|nr:phosphatase PAP2 family protein [Kyrpidia spormannii]CAB3389646.1 Phospholipid phosphatase [Kyrpidia spormannii]